MNYNLCFREFVTVCAIGESSRVLSSSASDTSREGEGRDDPIKGSGGAFDLEREAPKFEVGIDSEASLMYSSPFIRMRNRHCGNQRACSIHGSSSGSQFLNPDPHEKQDT